MNNENIFALYTPDGKTFKFLPHFPESIEKLQQEKREAIGYYTLLIEEPKVDDQHMAIPTGYERIDCGYKRIFQVVDKPIEVKKYSTLSIYRYLKSLGKWEDVKNILVQSGIYEDFSLANYLSSTDETFTYALNQVVEIGMLSKQQLDELLDKCQWVED